MSLINCEINLDLNWYKKCIIGATDVVIKVQHFR